MAYTVNSKTKRSISLNNWERPERNKSNFCASKFVDFCKRTDLHGYKYIVMEDFNNAERICWAVAVILSICFAVFFVCTAYRWYARNPIVTVIESTHGPIWDVPFPAVTVCDLNFVSRKAAQIFANNLTLPSNVTADKIFDTLRLVPLLHSDFNAYPKQRQDLYTLQMALDINNITIQAMFKALSPASSCNRLVQRCMWKNTIYRCDLLFQQVFTHLYLCCAFNYYAVEPFESDEKIKRMQPETPRRVASCGYETALTVLLNTETDNYYSASMASLGTLVVIDNAYNIPDLDSPFRIVNPSTEVLIALSPESTYATSGIKAFSPETRRCYYSDEMKIGSFRHYSYHNCMAFQKADTIRKKCNCIPFFFPTKDKIRACNFYDMDCLNDEQKMVDEYMTETDLNPCLPECEHFDYPLEVALGMLATHPDLYGLTFLDDVNMENRSLLKVFFNDLVSTRYRRDVYLNWQNILASFGGLLSLMLGFTLISGFDLLIYFTFRVTYDALTVMNENNLNNNNKSNGPIKHSKINSQKLNKFSGWKEGSTDKEWKNAKDFEPRSWYSRHDKNKY